MVESIRPTIQPISVNIDAPIALPIIELPIFPGLTLGLDTSIGEPVLISINGIPLTPSPKASAPQPIYY